MSVIAAALAPPFMSAIAETRFMSALSRKAEWSSIALLASNFG